MDFLDAFRQHLATLALGGEGALVAVSGGPDSVALLDLLVRAQEVHRLHLIVAHVDHGIHPASGRVAEQVRALAERYGLPVEIGQLGLGPAAGETAARTARYAWLDATRRRVGAAIVITAHHADDQAETVLMRVLHGSGPAGLASMAARRGTIVRPLLPFRREELAAYAAAAGLTVWLDPANADPRHLRSWIRAELLPAIREHIPDVDANVRRLASAAARDRAAWDAVLDQFPGVAFQVEQDGVSLAAAPLESAGPALLEALLLAAARCAGCPLGPTRLVRVVTLLRTGASGSAVPLGGDWRAQLSFGRLHLVADSAAVAGGGEPWTLQGSDGEVWWGRWRFRWRRGVAPARQEREGYLAWFVPETFIVRRWRPGDRVRPLAGAGQRPVAKCLQEAHAPRWRRESWPIMAVDNDVVWVPGACRSDVLVPAPAAEAVRIEVEYI